MLHARLAVLLACLVLARGDYVCPAAQCRPPSCICASTEPPVRPAPQFVVLTNDDAATVITTPSVLDMLDKAGRNTNGCPLPATWFISVEYTQPEFVQQLYMKGHEIATHTMHHVGLANASEIVAARTWLNETAGVPLGKIRGFRGPYLMHDSAQRDTLADAGFLYDSTITSTWGRGSFSPDGAHNVWPFTMDYGVPIDCAIGTGPCSTSERHPGLFEFPIWNLQDDEGRVVASMDPAIGNITELYMRELHRNYNGNRAPMGIFLHAARLVGSQEVSDQYAAFLRYALTLPDVWVVTIQEVLRWMANPVPADDYSLYCPTPTDMVFPGGRFCLPPAGGCVQGSWRPALCACTCLNQGNTSLPGFCPDAATGACTVVKQFDLPTRTWYCSAPEVEEADLVPTAASPSPSPNSQQQAGPAAATSPAATTPNSTATWQGVPGTTSSPAAAATPTASGTTGVGSASATQPTTSPSASSDLTATIQPLGGVSFAFFVQAEVAAFAARAQAVCDVLAALAGEAPIACSIASVTEAAVPVAPAARRLTSTGTLLVTAVLNPAAHTEEEVSAALMAAQADGRLAAALAGVGLQLAGVKVLSAAPGSNGRVVGAAIGGVVGGAALVALSVAVYFVVRAARALRSARTASEGRLPVSTRSQDEAPTAAAKHKMSPPAKGLHLTAKAGPSRLGDVPTTAYASTPRSSATPRHGGAFDVPPEALV